MGNLGTRNKYIKVRVYESEKLDFERRAEKRGVDQSKYAREKLFSDDNSNIYDEEVKNLLFNISSILYYDLEDHCDDQSIINRSKEAAVKLWQCLK